MPKYFTHYWNKNTFLHNTQMYDEPLPFNHTAGNDLKQKGIEVGDVAYGICCFDDTLYVIGKLQVDQIATTKDATEFLGYPAWEAKDHLLSEEGNHSATTDQAYVSGDDLEQITFVLKDGKQTGLKYNSSGHVEPMGLVGVRRITKATAEYFDALLAEAEELSEEVQLPTDEGGFASDELRREVEESAIEVAIGVFESAGYEVTDCQSDNCGYDLHCQGDDDELHVEVKGTSSVMLSFVMTRNEYDVAKEDPDYVLFVVTNALGESHGIDWHWIEQDEIFSTFDFEVIAYKARQASEDC